MDKISEEEAKKIQEKFNSFKKEIQGEKKDDGKKPPLPTPSEDNEEAK